MYKCHVYLKLWNLHSRTRLRGTWQPEDHLKSYVKSFVRSRNNLPVTCKMSHRDIWKSLEELAQHEQSPSPASTRHVDALPRYSKQSSARR